MAYDKYIFLNKIMNIFLKIVFINKTIIYEFVGLENKHLIQEF